MAAGLRAVGGAVLAPELGNHMPEVAAKYVGGMVAGGTASVITGGKFANGAVTAAFEVAMGEAARNNYPPAQSIPKYINGDPSSSATSGATITRDGNNINIDSKVFITGVNEVVVRAQAISAIESAWSGQFGAFNVTTRLHEVSNRKEANFVLDVRGAASSTIHRSNAGCNYLGCRMELYIQGEGNYRDVAAHEFGHILGWGDAYSPSTYQTFSGWRNNIMATQTGIVEERNIRPLVGGR